MQLFSQIARAFNAQNPNNDNNRQNPGGVNGLGNLFNINNVPILYTPADLDELEDENYNDNRQNPARIGLEAQIDFFTLNDPILIDRAFTITFRDWQIPKNDNLDNPPFDYPFHLIYSFLIENTRILQIFEKVLSHYVNSEVLTLANRPNPLLQNWVRNSEALFFRDPSASSFRNTVSRLRDREEAVRRNAYYRLFGMDLSHGDINNPANPVFQYQRSNINNREFVTLFSKLLTEIWQGYINRNNNVSANTTDINSINRTIGDLRDILLARRGITSPGQFNNEYPNATLTREEFSSVIMMAWFHHAIMWDSPVVSDLGAEGQTSADRLIKIGAKVGISPHPNTREFLELASPMAELLRNIEYDNFDGQFVQNNIIVAGNVVPPGANNILTIINLWEKATKVKIK